MNDDEIIKYVEDNDLGGTAEWNNHLMKAIDLTKTETIEKAIKYCIDNKLDKDSYFWDKFSILLDKLSTIHQPVLPVDDKRNQDGGYSLPSFKDAFKEKKLEKEWTKLEEELKPEPLTEDNVCPLPIGEHTDIKILQENLDFLDLKIKRFSTAMYVTMFFALLGTILSGILWFMV